MRWSPASLRNRLVLATVAAGLAFALLFAVAATWRVHRAEDQAVQAALQTRVELARDQVRRDGTLSQDAGSPKTDLVQVLGPDGTVRAHSPALSGVGALVRVADVRASTGGATTTLTLQHPDADLAVLAVPVRLGARGSSPGGTGALAVAVDAEGFNAATGNLLVLLLVGLLAVTLGMTALSWVLTGRALRNVTRLTESAELLGSDRSTTGLPSPSHDAELARLVAALNRMLARLHESHARELNFAADAGHRLRTPVATLRAEAELALDESDPLERTAALARIVADADRLTSIVDRMLARARTRSEPTERPLLDLVRESVPRWRRQAAIVSVSVEMHEMEVPPDACCGELVEVLDPLVDNAIRHSGPAGSVQLTVRVEPNTEDGGPLVVVDVTDDGHGVPAEVGAQLFEAWVSSRDASVAGGLGLWLARETARDRGGDVRLSSSGPDGTTFTVALPLVVRP